MSSDFGAAFVVVPFQFMQSKKDNRDYFICNQKFDIFFKLILNSI